MRSRLPFFAAVLLAILGAATATHAGTATSVSGLYYTGTNNSGGTISGGSQDPHWDVVYAQVAGNYYYGNSTYTGNAYVVSNNYIDGAWVPNSSTSKWIVPPGAQTSNGTANAGGDLLPGNGNAGTNKATYVYQLAFNIAGSGAAGEAVGNRVSISLTIAADDQYTVYVNPTLSGSTITSAAAGSRTNAWNNTSAEYLQNFGGNGHDANSNFVIGTNYIWVVVENTNSINGSSNSTSLNPSGLLVYQVGSAVTISNTPIPEVGTVLPVAGALGLFGLRFLRRRFGADKATSPASV